MTTKMLKFFQKKFKKKWKFLKQRKREVALLGGYLNFFVQCEQHSGAVKLLLPSPGLTCWRGSRRTRKPKRAPNQAEKRRKETIFIVAVNRRVIFFFFQKWLPSDLVWWPLVVFAVVSFFFCFVFQTGWSAAAPPPPLSLASQFTFNFF